MNRMQRLSRVLRRFASLSFALTVVLLIFSPGAVFLDDFTLRRANDALRHLDVDGIRFNSAHLGWLLRSFVGASMVIASATAILFLGALIRLLHQFEAGEAFSMESVRMVRFLGWIQVAMVPVDVLLKWTTAGVAKALTQQVVHPWIHMADAATANLFFGGVLLLVAYMLEEGCRLKSEQELVI